MLYGDLMSNLPSGTVTFLFTDIEGSTKLAQEYPDEMPVLLARHNEILNQAIQDHNGFVFLIVGDSYHAAFHNVSDAMHAVLDAQRTLLNEAWSPAPIKVRMGVHTGPAKYQEDSKDSLYSGYATLALTSRIMSAGHGGQILISQATHDLLVRELPENITLFDLGEHHLKDILQPQRLYQINTPDLPSEFAPLKTQKIINHNLPTRLTSFIGRARELSETNAKLDQARLLTLIGPGGTGKTRLSIQIGGEVLPNFSDGIWMIELAPLADQALIPQTIASVFGLRESADRSLIDLIIDYLRAKNLLIILDNCEHLVEACAKLAEKFLQACPQVKILASSREALGVSGETTYRVPSLFLPDQTQVTREALLDCESIQLFVDRAAAANPNFQLTDQNASSVAQICRRLDGIPLALELAAARVRVLSAEQVAERLDDRFRLLTGGSRTALPRQQTLRALIDWSYDLLSDSEKILFRRLAVFVGGWTLEAAEAVCAGDGVETYEVLDLLTQLVDKSLVIADERNGAVRYRRLETIHQYAREKLLETDEVVKVRDRHLDYYIEFTQAEDKNWFGLETNMHNALAFEDDNIRSALSWVIESDPIKSIELMSWVVVMGLWIMRGTITEARERCELIITALEKLPPDLEQKRALAHMLNRYSQALMNLGDQHASRNVSEKSVELAREVGDQKILAEALGSLGIGALYSGDPDYAFKVTEEGLTLSRQIGFWQAHLWALNTMTHIFNVKGDTATRMKYREEYIVQLQKAGGKPDPAEMEIDLSDKAYADGNIEAAIRHLQAAAKILEESGDTYRLINFDSQIAHTMRQVGMNEQALEYYRKTILVWQNFGHRAAVAHQLECFGLIAQVEEQLERTVKLFSAAEHIREIANSVRTPVEQTEFEEAKSKLQSQMDDSAFTKNWEAGRGLSMEQAIAFALEENT